jgi:hypothetical protein
MIKPARTLAVACVTTTLVLAACGGGSKKHPSTPPPTPTSTPTSSSAAPTKAAAPAVNPFTGLKPSNNPVIAVKIDDTGNGRPQVNIDKADVVYVEQVEGGLTRLAALYQTNLPTVEAVRSVRASDPELFEQFGPIGFVASGGGGDSLQVLDASPLKASINDRGGPGFARDSGREVPYNLTANLAAVAAALKPAKVTSGPWTFGAITSPSFIGARVNTVVGATGVTFVYDRTHSRYVRYIGGVLQHAADGATISTPNVIVQFCNVVPYPRDVDVAGNVAQYTHTIGKGKVAVFRNGREIVGTWSRVSAKSGTRLVDKNGKPINLATGGAWVLLVATNAPLST